MGFICPVCGYPNLKEQPPIQKGDTYTYEICPCCFVEFGYDAFWNNYPMMRRKWIEGGAPWGSRYTKLPEGWDWKKQLQNLGIFVEEELQTTKAVCKHCGKKKVKATFKKTKR